MFSQYLDTFHLVANGFWLFSAWGWLDLHMGRAVFTRSLYCIEEWNSPMKSKCNHTMYCVCPCPCLGWSWGRSGARCANECTDDHIWNHKYHHHHTHHQSKWSKHRQALFWIDGERHRPSKPLTDWAAQGIHYLPIRCRASCIKSQLWNVYLCHELIILCQFLQRIPSGILDAHPMVGIE